MGACSALALKRATKEIAIAVGMTFAGLQTLAYMGYITIDYNRVSKDASKVMDVNGDGKLDSKDFLIIWDKIKDVLGYHLPQAGSFTTGFAFAFYYL